MVLGIGGCKGTVLALLNLSSPKQCLVPTKEIYAPKGMTVSRKRAKKQVIHVRHFLGYISLRKSSREAVFGAAGEIAGLICSPALLKGDYAGPARGGQGFVGVQAHPHPGYQQQAIRAVGVRIAGDPLQSTLIWFMKPPRQERWQFRSDSVGETGRKTKNSTRWKIRNIGQ